MFETFVDRLAILGQRRVLDHSGEKDGKAGERWRCSASVQVSWENQLKEIPHKLKGSKKLEKQQVEDEKKFSTKCLFERERVTLHTSHNEAQ